jgi:hypothetical protein
MLRFRKRGNPLLPHIGMFLFSFLFYSSLLLLIALLVPLLCSFCFLRSRITPLVLWVRSYLRGLTFSLQWLNVTVFFYQHFEGICLQDRKVRRVREELYGCRAREGRAREPVAWVGHFIHVWLSSQKVSCAQCNSSWLIAGARWVRAQPLPQQRHRVAVAPSSSRSPHLNPAHPSPAHPAPNMQANKVRVTWKELTEQPHGLLISALFLLVGASPCSVSHSSLAQCHLLRCDAMYLIETNRLAASRFTVE